ncbi:hypothetical protein L1987_20948 [Smallanthus sonchifolius]|uniref:Uncharacterized protein n=1 Tax=Smallanthus sonchifolius TaxID=185202 RepID=A0ACB9IT84_9ASTR|nr:hypothetical protein L1987_20948 [Smallanthus sonchifolius]
METGVSSAGGGGHLPSIIKKLHFGIIKKISWMEKFVRNGIMITAPVPMASPKTTGLGGFEAPSSKGDALRCDERNFNVGVLHLVPSLEVFPLLVDPKTYWFGGLPEHLPDLVDKAVASEGGTDDARRRGNAFAQALIAHMDVKIAPISR